MNDDVAICTRAEVLRFVGLAYGLGYAAQLLAVHTGLREGGGGGPWLAVAMWTPALAALLSGRGPRRLVLAGLKRFPVRSLGLALVAGSALSVLSWAFSAVLGTGRWNSETFELDAARTHITTHKVATVLGAIQPKSLPLFALDLALSVVLASLVGAVFVGIGEEIGWRGVLQPALEKRLGFVRGTAAVGLFWAYWHLPVNLAGYNDARHPVLTALVLFPVGALALAFAFGGLFRKTGSIWLCAVAHMANNSWSGAPLVKTASWGADNATSILAAITMIALVIRSSRAGAAAPALRPASAG